MGIRHHRNRQRENTISENGDNLLSDSLFLVVHVPQDPISDIHPPCIYAGDVTNAMGFDLCRSKMMNGIVALHSGNLNLHKKSVTQLSFKYILLEEFHFFCAITYCLTSFTFLFNYILLDKFYYFYENKF